MVSVDSSKIQHSCTVAQPCESQQSDIFRQPTLPEHRSGHLKKNERNK